MKFNPFQVAAQKAKEAIGEKKWNALTFAEQSAAIYRKLRSIDAELASGSATREKDTSLSRGPTQASTLPRVEPAPEVRRNVEPKAA